MKWQPTADLDNHGSLQSLFLCTWPSPTHNTRGGSSGRAILQSSTSLGRLSRWLVVAEERGPNVLTINLRRRTKDPNEDGTAVNETLFEKVEKLRRYQRALKRRVSPYMVEGVIEEEHSDLGSSVKSHEEHDQLSIDSDEEEFETLQKRNFAASIGAVALLVLLAGVIGFAVWWTISRNSEFLEPPRPVDSTPPPLFVPEDLGPMFVMKIILQGLAKDMFDVVEVRRAYIGALRKMPPLTRYLELMRVKLCIKCVCR